MPTNESFSYLNAQAMMALINSAKRSVAYAAPSISTDVANSIVAVANRIGSEMITVRIELSERVFRMGYGKIDAVESLIQAKIDVQDVADFRVGLLVVDDVGYAFTPVALYLEADRAGVLNAVKLTGYQVKEAIARLSPVGKVIAMAQAGDEAERASLEAIESDVASKPIDGVRFREIKVSLKTAPPAKFDLERQVRVYQSYLQYVELHLIGAKFRSKKVTLPASLQDLGIKDSQIIGRLTTSFDLIHGSKSSLKTVDKQVEDLRKNYLRSLGGRKGSVLLKSNKSTFETRLVEIGSAIKTDKERLVKELTTEIANTKDALVKHFVDTIVGLERLPDAIVGHVGNKASESQVALWVSEELAKVMPAAESLVESMRLECQYKDVTIETLNSDDFLATVREAFPYVGWDKAHDEFNAVSESTERADGN
jgi:hypothetical protein